LITHLDPVQAPPRDLRDGAGPDHPMRLVTRESAFSPEAWTPQRRQEVGAMFDDLAAEWHTRDLPGRTEQLEDACDRGLPAAGWTPPPRRVTCLEVGSGTGLFTQVLTDRFEQVVAVDLAFEMLRIAPAELAPRVQADAAQLPLADRSVELAVLVNALLFPAEVDRILAPGGAVVWVNSRGSGTPIHLPIEDVADALPGDWSGAASAAGEGTWGVVVRDAAG
jgi:SAM-dependent methyltransferase